MKVAIMLTGALRTIKKTMRYFKQNLLLNSEVDVFACIQNDTSISNEEWNTWLKQEIGANLKVVEWFNPQTHSFWLQHRDYILQYLHVHDGYKNYLKSSGSMIEYFQLQIAYMHMITFERCNGFRYDYIIRARTDTVYGKPVDFHWLNWSQTEVMDRVEKIRNMLLYKNKDASDDNVLTNFMNTILSDDIIPNIENLNGGSIPYNNGALPKIDELTEYIKTGRYILTFRSNLLYIIKREYFYLIPSLGTFYGFQDYYKSESGFWWNAETQFLAACHNSNLTIFNYNTVFDDKSLYEYDEKRYFDENFNILNPYMIFCIVRN
jgi:hypothetical protein